MSLKIPPPPVVPVGVQYDAERNIYWVPVSPDLLPEMVNGWSPPVHVKIENGDMVFQRVESFGGAAQDMGAAGSAVYSECGRALGAEGGSTAA
jgi:hypothetical protein